MFNEKSFRRFLESGEVIAEDQDTAVSDSFVEALALIMSVCDEINANIKSGDIQAIPMDRVRAAERAWYFTSGMSHGLAIDRPEFKEALEYMRAAICSIQRSRDNGFQNEVYTIPRDLPSLLNFNFGDALEKAVVFYLGNIQAPLRRWLDESQRETDKLKEGVCAYTRDPNTNEPTTVGTCSSDSPGYHKLGPARSEDSGTATEIVRHLLKDGDIEAMDEAVNEFGEKTETLDPKHAVVTTLDQIAHDIQIDPYDRDPKVDRIMLEKVESVKNGSHCIATVYGGANGGGGDNKWEIYLMLVRKFIAEVSEKLSTNVWLVDWNNDCPDDCWTLRIGFHGLKKD